MSNKHITDERAAFEAWYQDHHGSRVCFSQYDTGPFEGDYRDALVAGAWNVWQASRAALRPAAQPVGEPVAWRWMPSQVFPMWVYSDDKNRVMEALRFMGHGGVQPLYNAPQPVAVPDRVPMTDELEQALEMLVEQCNQDAVFSGAQAVIHAEAVLERLYKSRTDINTPKDASL